MGDELPRLEDGQDRVVSRSKTRGLDIYVIVHELAHVEEPNHDEAFWKTVERAMPDYRQRKRWLAENGARYVA